VELVPAGSGLQPGRLSHWPIRELPLFLDTGPRRLNGASIQDEEKKKKKKGKVELHDEMKANYKEQGNKESCNINGDILLSSVWNYE